MIYNIIKRLDRLISCANSVCAPILGLHRLQVKSHNYMIDDNKTL